MYRFKSFTKKIKLAIKVVLLLWFSIIGSYSAHAFIFSEDLEDRVYVIEKNWQYKILKPNAGSSLGFTYTILGVAYVNKEAVLKTNSTVEEIIKHEAKHIEQFKSLGLKSFVIETWKREGVADYARGSPTANLCSPSVNESNNRLRYRDYFIMVKYLLEKEGLSESEVYDYEGYPLTQATDWLLNVECEKA